MRDALTATVQAIGYALITGAAVWLLVSYAPS